MRNWIISIIVLLVVLNVTLAVFYQPAWWFLLITGPLFFLMLHDINQTQHTILRNFPVVGHVRWGVEALRPYLQQYVIESDTGGAPISRMFRSIVYYILKGVFSCFGVSST